MVGMSASVNLPLHHKVQKFSSGTSSPGWSLKKGRKTVLVVVMSLICTILEIQKTLGKWCLFSLVNLYILYLMPPMQETHSNFAKVFGVRKRE